MYMYDNARDGASTETMLSNANAGQLDVLWLLKTGGAIAAQPAIVGGTVYVGSWDGYEYSINESTGAINWQQNLGQTVACNATQGVTSSAEVVGGNGSTGVVYVGGGDSYWYALRASDGTVLWRVFTGDNSVTGGHYNWSSPLIDIANGYAYIGISSLGDCPLVPGQVFKVSLTTHNVVATTKLTNNNDIGAGVWTSPTLDSATNTIYVTTGTIHDTSETYAQAIVAIDANTMAIKDSWQVPVSQTVPDSDWGTSPILFTDSTNRQLVGAINKNGILYAFQRSNLAAGPVWQRQVAIGGGCPQCGEGSVSNLTFANGVLYAAGAATTINGYGYQGSVRALDPATGISIWEHGDLGSILPALAYDNGLIFAGTGNSLEVLDAATGTRLYSYNTWGPLFGPPAVSNGTVVFGSTTGYIYAVKVPTTSPPPSDPNCPTNWTCQDLHSPSPAGSEAGPPSATTWTISADGAGITDGSDQVRYISQTVSGNMQITADLTGLSGGNSAAQVGLMVRGNTNPKSPAYAIVAQPGGTVTVMYRWAYTSAMQTLATLSGANLPLYVEIQRIGDRFQAATSPDGITYTLVPGTTVQLTLANSIPVGVTASSGANGTLASATVSAVTVSSTLTPPTPAPSASPCPTGWSCADVGNPATVGDQSLSGTGQSWTLSGSGPAFGVNAFDQFHYVWQPLPGDGMATLHVVSQSNTNASAQAGVMLRQSTDPSATFYGVFVTPGDGIEVFYRDTPGANVQTQTSATGAAPAYVGIVRSGTTFTAYTSNGAAWTPIAGSSVTLGNLSGSLLAGAAVTSAVAGTASTVTANTLYAGGCPTGWSCGDVGAVGLGGSQANANGVWTIAGSGGDIGGTSDGFHFVSQALASDGTLSARVESLGQTDPAAKAGLMFRAGTAANAPFFALVYTPNGSLDVLYRAGPGAAVVTAAQLNGSLGSYVRIARFGPTFTAYTSTDGTTWTPIGPAASLSQLPGTVQAGLVVTSHTSSALTLATFDGVTLTAATGCPAGWTCTDIGSPPIAGSQSSAGALWSVSGSGGDLTGTADQFGFVYQPIGTNDTLATGVIAQTNTSAAAKAGVMLRGDTSAGAVFYGVFATPGSGIVVEDRATAGGSATQLVSVPGVAPKYLRVTTVAGSFTAYTSGDGLIWQPIAGSTVTIAALSGSSVLAGLAVTSVNPSLASQAIVTTTAFSVTSVAPPPPPSSRLPR